jgi:hypothetical protein
MPKNVYFWLKFGAPASNDFEEKKEQEILISQPLKKRGSTLTRGP